MAAGEFDDFEGSGLPAFLWDPLGIVRRRWRWMALAMILGAAATTVFILRMKPRYEAVATVMIATQTMPEEFVRSTVREDPFERTNAMVGEILARPKLASLIEKYDLYRGFRATIPLGELAAWMREDITVAAKQGIGGQSRFETARLLTIAFESDHPQAAADVANSLATFLSEAGMRLRTSQAELTTDFMERELARAETELREQDRAVAEFKTKYRGELPADLAPTISTLARLQEQRQSLALQITETESRLLEISSIENSPDVRLVQLRADLAEELGVHTERHPNVVSLRRKIENLEAEVGRSGGSDGSPSQATVLSSSRNTLAELKRQRLTAERRIAELEEKVGRIPQRQEELEALEEKEDVLQATYTDFLRKVQEAGLAQNLEHAQQGARISILEPAEPPLRPTRSRMKFSVLGAAVTLASAFGIAILLELIAPVLVASGDQRTVEDIPILGAVPRIG